MIKKIIKGKKVQYINWPCLEIFSAKVTAVTQTLTGKKKYKCEVEMSSGDTVNIKDIIQNKAHKKEVQTKLAIARIKQAQERIWEMTEYITRHMNKIRQNEILLLTINKPRRKK